MFKNNSIRKRVMAVIQERINEAQVKADNEIKGLKDKHSEDQRMLDHNLEVDKADVIERSVQEILGKVL